MNEMTIVFAKVVSAVQFAHESEGIHCVLKPHNISMDMHGEPKVTDFGLVKRRDMGEALTAISNILERPS